MCGHIQMSESTVGILQLCARSWSQSGERPHYAEVLNIQRGQLIHFQSCVPELIWAGIRKGKNSITIRDNCRLDHDTEGGTYDEIAQALVEAVCANHSVPKYVTEEVVKAANNQNLDHVKSLQTHCFILKRFLLTHGLNESNRGDITFNLHTFIFRWEVEV